MGCCPCTIMSVAQNCKALYTMKTRADEVACGTKPIKKLLATKEARPNFTRHGVLPLHHNECCSKLQKALYTMKTRADEVDCGTKPIKKSYLRQKKHAQTLPFFTSVSNVLSL